MPYRHAQKNSRSTILSNHLIVLVKAELENGSKIPIILLGNKCDATNKDGLKNSQQKLERICAEKGFAAWYHTSAKVKARNAFLLIFKRAGYWSSATAADETYIIRLWKFFTDYEPMRES